MYKTKRLPKEGVSATVSTPDFWADNFSGAGKLSLRQRINLVRDYRWKLIKRYIPKQGPILDAGCGAGEWVEYLNSKSRICEGLDYSDKIIQKASRRYPNYSWKVGDISALPYSDDYFSGVISWGVIEHDEEGPGKFLREFYRVLKKNGVAIITVPCDSPTIRRSVEMQFPETEGAKFFSYLMTADELREHVKVSGFDVLDSGLIPRTSLALLSPKLYIESKGLKLKILNRLVWHLLFWNRKLYNMQYCVAIKS